MNLTFRCRPSRVGYANQQGTGSTPVKVMINEVTVYTCTNWVHLYCNNKIQHVSVK